MIRHSWNNSNLISADLLSLSLCTGLVIPPKHANSVDNILLLFVSFRKSGHGHGHLCNSFENLVLPFHKDMSSGRLGNSELYSIAINPHFPNNDKYVMCPTDRWLRHWLLPGFSITMTNKYGCAAGGLGTCAFCLVFLKGNTQSSSVFLTDLI